MAAIRIANSDAEIKETFAVMCQLRPHLRGTKRRTYLELVRRQQSEVGFQLAVLRRNGRVLCVAGFRLCRCLGWGRYLYIDDLVTNKKMRSKGAGHAMFQWLVKYGLDERCDQLRLDSAVFRHGAHRFYLRERMDIACFNFRLELGANVHGAGRGTATPA